MAKNEIKILGAGLSGLTAAINLAKAGKDVRVFEKRKAVGEQIHPNFQCLKTGPNESMRDCLAKHGLEPKHDFGHVGLSKDYFLTRHRSIHLIHKRQNIFVLRGGKKSLEYALFLQAKKLGVGFEFESKAAERDVNIVASGPKKVTCAAFGMVYEDTALGDGEFLMMFDDRYSPKGWYLYALPTMDGGMKIVNCAAQPYAPSVKKLLLKALRERPELKELVGSQKPASTFGGFGYVDMPRSAIAEGRLYAGEAAGFQDAFAGFGMEYALLSGKLAADSFIHSVNYDSLWKKALMPGLKLHFAQRFVMSILGDRFIEMAMHRYANGDVVDFYSFVPRNRFWYGALVDSFCRAEILKKRMTGYW